MTSVCSVGLDMIAIPGDTSAATISGMIADEMAIGMINSKTTAVRIIPVPGKGVGEKAVFGGLLGEAAIIRVPGGDSTGFVKLGGRIPAPIHSLKNRSAEPVRVAADAPSACCDDHSRRRPPVLEAAPFFLLEERVNTGFGGNCAGSAIRYVVSFA